LNEVQAFVFEDLSVRGAVVRLEETWQQVVAQHHYPESIERLLGDSVAATVLLASGLKGRPSISLQLQGDGPVKLLLVQCSGALKVRGMAQWQGDTADETLLGSGRLAVNIDPGADGPKYQGIVPLSGPTLDACLEAYFEQSEQLATRLYLRCHGTSVSGLLLQLLPSAEDGADELETLAALAATITGQELQTLDSAALLRRLFAGYTLRLFQPHAVTHDCRCTAEHLAGIVRMLGAAEVNDILAEQGKVELTCEFCNRSFRYDDADIAKILAGGVTDPPLHCFH
jgi:molecular chaperone Hsp33